MKKLAIVLAALLLASVFVGCGTPAKELLNTAWEVKWGGNGSYSLLVFAEEDVVTYQDFDVSDNIFFGCRQYEICCRADEKLCRQDSCGNLLC